MKIFGDFHTHTIYSRRNHAKGTIEENAEAALRAGLTELHITDHGPGHILYGVDRKKFPEIRRTIDKLNQKYAGRLKLYFGMESNVMSYDGDIDLFEEEIAMLDKLSVGFHYGIIPQNLKSFFYFCIVNPLSKILPFLRPFIVKKNTDALIKIVDRYPIDTITHPGSKAEVDVKRLAAHCAKCGTALEINSYHGRLTVEEIRRCIEVGCEMTIGSDAHSPERVGDVEAALRRAKEARAPIALIRNIREEKQ